MDTKFQNSGVITAGHDINIINNENNFLPFEACENEVLKNEVGFRKKNIKIEQKKKIKETINISGTLLFTLVIVCIVLWITGQTEIANSIIALGSLSIAYLSYKKIEKPTKQQIYETNTIKNINHILKSRRAI